MTKPVWMSVDELATITHEAVNEVNTVTLQYEDNACVIGWGSDKEALEQLQELLQGVQAAMVVVKARAGARAKAKRK